MGAETEAFAKLDEVVKTITILKQYQENVVRLLS